MGKPGPVVDGLSHLELADHRLKLLAHVRDVSRLAVCTAEAPCAVPLVAWSTPAMVSG